MAVVLPKQLSLCNNYCFSDQRGQQARVLFHGLFSQK